MYGVLGMGLETCWSSHSSYRVPRIQAPLVLPSSHRLGRFDAHGGEARCDGVTGVLDVRPLVLQVVDVDLGLSTFRARYERVLDHPAADAYGISDENASVHQRQSELTRPDDLVALGNHEADTEQLDAAHGACLVDRPIDLVRRDGLEVVITCLCALQRPKDDCSHHRDDGNER